MRAAAFCLLVLLSTAVLIAADHECEALFARQEMPVEITAIDVPAGQEIFLSGTSTPLFVPVTACYLNGRSSMQGWTIQYRSLDAAGSWSVWRNGEIHKRKFGRFWVKLDIEGARQFQYRVIATASLDQCKIELYGIDLPDLHA